MAIRHLGSGVGHINPSEAAQPERYATPIVEEGSCDLSAVPSYPDSNSINISAESSNSDSDSDSNSSSNCESIAESSDSQEYDEVDQDSDASEVSSDGFQSD